MSDKEATEDPATEGDVSEQQADADESEPAAQSEQAEPEPVGTGPADTETGEQNEPGEQTETAETEENETAEAEQNETAEAELAGQTETEQPQPDDSAATEQTETVEPEAADKTETEQSATTEPGQAELTETVEGEQTEPAPSASAETGQTEGAPAKTGQTEGAPVVADEQAADAGDTKEPQQVESAPEEEKAAEQVAEAQPQPVPETAYASEKAATSAGDGEKKDAPAQEGKTEVQRESKQVGGDTQMPADEPGAMINISSEHMVELPVNLSANATVKFVLMPSGQVVTLACTLGQTLRQLKEHFASELKMPYNLILLMHDGKGMDDNTTLADLGVGPNGTVQLELQSADPVNVPIKAYRPRQEYHMPDVITVRVQAEDGSLREVIVEIERTTRKKPYLGGYRHKDTGVEFHNASAQTMKMLRPPPPVDRYCRDTQTTEQWHKVQQTSNDMATQMTKIGVYVSNITDKLISPRKYTTADEHLDMVLQKIIILQKNYRRWLAKRRVQKLRDDKKKRLDWEREEELRKLREKEERIKQEFERRMNPRKKDDFDLLYHALEKWRLEETERINSTLTGAERKAALYMLLDQETQLLAAIDRHKLEADDTNKKLRILTFLDKAAAPKTWKGRDGKPTQMDTPFTIRARELKDIYNSINMKYLTQDERLDVLLTLKHTVKEHDCKLTQEIIELIDREADLLMRGVKESNLDGLRKRISTLFLQYTRTPTFNPEAARLLKVPQDPSTLRKNIYFCSGCNNYLPSTEFPLSSNSRVVGKCRQCNKIDNDGRVRQDYSHYRYMLKTLRLSEEAYGDQSQIAFLLQESDLRYLVENIWSSQSTLSAWDDLFDLVLVRWDRNEEWSPWNCILLTKDEAAAHDKLRSLEEGYGQVFIHKVKQKHTLARNYFSRLPGMAELVRKKASQKDTGTRGPSVSGTSVPVQQKA